MSLKKGLGRRKLKKVGKVLHKSKMAPNIIIAKIKDYLKPGIVVYNMELERIGVVIETFGPVKSPYARIKLDENIEPKNDEPIFIITGEVEKVRWKKMPKKRGRYG